MYKGEEKKTNVEGRDFFSLVTVSSKFESYNSLPEEQPRASFSSPKLLPTSRIGTGHRPQQQSGFRPSAIKKNSMARDAQQHPTKKQESKSFKSPKPRKRKGRGDIVQDHFGHQFSQMPPCAVSGIPVTAVYFLPNHCTNCSWGGAPEGSCFYFLTA